MVPNTSASSPSVVPRTAGSRAVLALGIAAIYGLMAWGSVTMSLGSGRIAALWIANAFVIGLLLRAPLKQCLPVLGLCLAAAIGANLAIGDDWFTALSLALANSLECAIVLAAMHRLFGATSDMGQLRHVLGLAAAGLLAPMLTGTVAALTVHAPGVTFQTSSWWQWLAAHAIPIAIFAPLVAIARAGAATAKLPMKTQAIDGAAVALATIIAAIAIFDQTTYPFLFLAGPVVLFAAFRTGLIGTALVVTLFAVAAILATELGIGPISLVQGGEREQMLTLQLFLAACFAVGLPVAAALENRAAIRRDLLASRDFVTAIVDGLGVVVFKTDAAGRWIFLNSYWEELTGYPVEESLGERTTRLLLPEDAAAATHSYPQIVSGEIAQIELEQRFVTADGRVRDIAVSLRRLTDENGNFSGTVGKIRDITESLAREYALKESETRFRRMADAAPVGIFQADRMGELTFANSAWARKLGVETAAMLGQGWKASLKNGEEYIDDAAFTGFDKPGDIRRRLALFVDAAGNDLWGETVTAAEFDRDGKILGFVGVVNDVTEQRQSLIKLEESERLFQSLTALSPAGIFRTDATGSVNYVNHEWKRISQLGDGEWEGWSWTSAVHPDDIELVHDMWADAVANGTELDIGFRWQRADGSIVWTDAYSAPERNDAGQVIGFIGLVMDVNERKQAERILAEREEQLSILADNATDAIMKITLDGICTYASPSVETLFGVASAAFVGRSLLRHFHPDDAEGTLAAFRALAAGAEDKTLLSYRTAKLTAPGEYAWIEAHCGLLRDPDTGAPHEIIASLRNIDATKALEEQLRQAKEQAEQAADAKSTFLATMSHEIRTPMNGVIGFTELALSGELNREQRENIELIADSGRAMMRLLNDILDMAKIEAGQMTITSEPVDLRHKLSGSVRLMEPVAKAKAIGLSLEIDPDLPAWVASDSMHLRQIVLNLIGNALKFTDFGSVRVKVAVAGDAATPTMQICVIDSGIGIAADRVDHVFGQFTQADSGTARRYGGTGLGLAISLQLAQKMGGTLTATSIEGAGSTFTLALPLVECAAPAAQAEATSADGEPLPRSHQRILAAEDNEINQTLVRRMVEQLGHTIEIAQDGREAIAMVRAAAMCGNPYALVLMDMQMPVMDGLEATRQLRALGFDAATLPILSLSANAYKDDIDAARAAGMQDHLAKPVRRRDLDRAITRWGAALAALPVPDASAVDDEEIVDEQLAARFAARKHEAAEAIALALRQNQLDAVTIGELSGLLHKIAGTAGFFGQEALGTTSAALETALRGKAHADARPWLQQALDSLAA